MAKPIIYSASKENKILWQQTDEGVGEPALMIEAYSDCICITQEESIIRLNFDSVDELTKLLKKLKPL